jgi:hypothetical protein
MISFRLILFSSVLHIPMVVVSFLQRIWTGERLPNTNTFHSLSLLIFHIYEHLSLSLSLPLRRETNLKVRQCLKPLSTLVTEHELSEVQLQFRLQPPKADIDSFNASLKIHHLPSLSTHNDGKCSKKWISSTFNFNFTSI